MEVTPVFLAERFFQGDIDQWMQTHSSMARAVGCVALAVISTFEATYCLSAGTFSFVVTVLVFPVILFTRLMGFNQFSTHLEAVFYPPCAFLLKRSYCSAYAALTSGLICSGLQRFGDITWSMDGPARLALRQRIATNTVDTHGEMIALCALPMGKERSARYEELVQTRFTLENVRGDGNCCLRAVVRSLYPDCTPEQEDERITAMRQRMVEHMRHNRDQFERFIEGDFDAYLAQMACGGTWLDNPELRALSESEGINIHVYSAVNPQIDWTGRIRAAANERFAGGGLFPRRTAHIYYESDHYQALYSQR